MKENRVKKQKISAIELMDYLYKFPKNEPIVSIPELAKKFDVKKNYIKKCLDTIKDQHEFRWHINRCNKVVLNYKGNKKE